MRSPPCLGCLGQESGLSLPHKVSDGLETEGGNVARSCFHNLDHSSSCGKRGKGGGHHRNEPQNQQDWKQALSWVSFFTFGAENVFMTGSSPMFSSILGLYPSRAISTPSLGLIKKCCAENLPSVGRMKMPQ